MALHFDMNHLPTCCGVGLVPGTPYTSCQICKTRFDTDELCRQILQRRAAGPETGSHNSHSLHGDARSAGRVTAPPNAPA